MSAVDDVVSFLTDQGLAAGSTGWQVLRRRMMDQPAADQLVVVSEDGGAPPEISASAGIGDAAMKDVGVLVTVRGTAWDSDATMAKAAEILASLHGQAGTEIGSTLYYRVRALTGEPVFAGFDERGRPHHTVAFRLLADF